MTSAPPIRDTTAHLERLLDLPDDAGPDERETARNDAIEAGIPMADRLARRYENSGEPLDDLRQVARLGLVKAVDGFDPSMGRPFAAYAIPTIHGELKRHFRDKGWAIRVPRRVQEARLRVQAVQPELAQRLHRTPTADDIAEEVELPIPEVHTAMHADQLYQLRSTNKPVSQDGTTEVEVGDLVPALDDALEAADGRVTVRRMLADLPYKQRCVLYLRFFHNMSQSQIAARIGVSQMHVSRMLNRTLTRMRARLA
ncbi:RNA polymerase sigma-B factor [Stackebrandtia albiflava]|uniref:RNA polymerase sigma-B factor n=1 Tax=Stackebrandtia albiflava TaxID=406432 RepID=A0A562VCI7_9ACTN|nr:SigB/SigF/SigG family RNA polymerase sigma factor [Stackebrandtia albiflava]TWJ15575.1 RNA polymerase sigma-B factor [Stackebrandtia albiflava]